MMRAEGVAHDIGYLADGCQGDHRAHNPLDEIAVALRPVAQRLQRSYRYEPSGAPAIQLQPGWYHTSFAVRLDSFHRGVAPHAMRSSSCAFGASAGRRSYDHRIRQAICETGDPGLFDSVVHIPRSTAKSWLRRGRPSVVSLEDEELEVFELRLQVAMLERRIDKYRKAMRKLAAVASLWRAELAAFDVSLENCRAPAASAKERLLEAAGRARAALTLVMTLRVLRLSSARYHAWRRAQKECGLEDRSSCPKTSPSQLTASELQVMKGMATSEELRHMPIATLALYAQRLGRVFAAPATWSKKIRERKWKRPRKRVYPAKPKVGIRASEPNQIWHLDVTVIRLLDGSKVFMHGVIDNFSRRILAWRICKKLDPTTTVAILREAASEVVGTPTLVTDSGVENVNGKVDMLVRDSVVRRVLALVDVSYSNSVIEAYWRTLKNQWLFLHALDSFSAVEKLVAFHVEQHNSVMPHSAFRGQTPDEVYWSGGGEVTKELAAARRAARQARLATNRALACSACTSENAAMSTELHVHQLAS